MDAPLLLVEDTPSLRMVYSSVLKGAGYEVVTAATAADGLDRFRSESPKVVLLDLMLPDRDGLELMKDCLSHDPDTRFVVITANGSINRAVDAMRAGAFEFLVKPFDETRFLSAVSNALEDLKRPSAKSAPKPTESLDPPGKMIGASDAMAEIYGKMHSVSGSMATVFITGESGTGKELCAKTLHDISNRADGPFVALNCGAIPAGHLESEVFGHLKRSFPGALSDSPGAAQRADGGTLFLDDICELDLNLQTKLLRFLQTSSIQPVGAAEPTKVNVRIICASTTDPLNAVRRGRFKEDLYYRLHVVPMHLPPLRERGDDVIEIAQMALTAFAKEEARAFRTMSDEVKALFRAHSWPGNVRQLLNVLRSVVVLNDGQVVTASMLPMEVHHNLRTDTPPDEARPEVVLDALLGKTLDEIERMVIEHAIEAHGGSIPRAARVLDVSPSTIYRKREAWAARERTDAKS